MFPTVNVRFDLYPCRCWPRWSHFVAWLAWTWHVYRICFHNVWEWMEPKELYSCRFLWFPNIPSTYQGTIRFPKLTLCWHSKVLEREKWHRLHHRRGSDCHDQRQLPCTCNYRFLALIGGARQARQMWLALTRRIRWGVDLHMVNYSWIYDICMPSTYSRVLTGRSVLEARFVWWTRGQRVGRWWISTDAV